MYFSVTISDKFKSQIKTLKNYRGEERTALPVGIYEVREKSKEQFDLIASWVYQSG